MAGLKGIRTAVEAARKAAGQSRGAGVLSRLEREMGSTMGEFGRQRVQRAADEIPGLERMYSPEALRQAFGARGLMTLPPTRFEDFAFPIGSLDPAHVSKLARVRRYDDVPYLDLDRPMAGLGRPMEADWLAIAGHEGRHRNRAMAQRGDPAGLVRVEPSWGGPLEKEVDALVPVEGPMRRDEGRPMVKPSPEERLARMREALGEGRMVRPQSALWGPQRDLRQLPEVYAGGGRVGALARATEAARKAARNAQEARSVEAWHGTPHLFPPERGAPLGRFRAEKIGTGEGRQAYGRGHYLAEARNIGEYYRDALTPRSLLVRGNEPWKPAPMGGEDLISVLLQSNSGDYAETLKDLRQSWSGEDLRELVGTLERMKYSGVHAEPAKGHLLRVQVPQAVVGRMLDWDRPLEVQPEIARVFGGGKKTKAKPGRDAFNALEERLGPEGATQYLSEREVPGVRYLDALSRGKGDAPTRNMVVFPEYEESIEIVDRFQKGGKVGALNRIARIGDEVVRLMDSGPRHV